MGQHQDENAEHDARKPEADDATPRRSVVHVFGSKGLEERLVFVLVCGFHRGLSIYRVLVNYQQTANFILHNCRWNTKAVGSENMTGFGIWNDVDVAFVFLNDPPHYGSSSSSSGS